MKCFDIRRMPTNLDDVHESVYRSYHVLEKVQELLDQDTPHKVILEIIDDLQTEPIEDYLAEKGRVVELESTCVKIKDHIDD